MPSSRAIVLTLSLAILILGFAQWNVLITNRDLPFKLPAGWEMQQSTPAVPVPVEGKVEVNLPGYCHYCTETDELCTKYGPYSLARSVAYAGTAARLRRILNKAFANNEPLKVAAIGGSVTAGHGVSQDKTWISLYGQWLRDNIKTENGENLVVEVINGAKRATGSKYFDSCFGLHIDDDVDIVILELAINNARHDSVTQAFENLIRGLLSLPHQPAVMNLQTMALHEWTIAVGGDLDLAVGMYYDVPTVNVRNVLLPHVFSQTPENAVEVLSYWFANYSTGPDLRHLVGPGHQMMSDILASLTARVWCEELSSAALSSTSSWASWQPPQDGSLPGSDILEYIPRESLWQKYNHYTTIPPIHPICNSTSSAAHPLIELPPPYTVGFEANWTFNGDWQKPYLRATEPGSKVGFKVEVGGVGRVRLTYLRSMTFGLGSMACHVRAEEDEDEKGKKTTRVDGWWDKQGINAEDVMTIGQGLSPGTYILSCELLKESKDPGGGTEFRIMAVDSA